MNQFNVFEQGAFVNPLQSDSLMELLVGIVRAVVYVGSVALILALIWAGFLFVRAQGNPGELQKARQTLLWTVLGGAILLGAEGIARLVEATAGNLAP